VTDGLDVVRRIGAVSTDQTERPSEPIVIERIKIETS
jgi:cyclophilin family peptidyl-prolyl cis-trans isomerase